MILNYIFKLFETKHIKYKSFDICFQATESRGLDHFAKLQSLSSLIDLEITSASTAYCNSADTTVLCLLEKQPRPNTCLIILFYCQGEWDPLPHYMSNCTCNCKAHTTVLYTCVVCKFVLFKSYIFKYQFNIRRNLFYTKI